MKKPCLGSSRTSSACTPDGPVVGLEHTEELNLSLLVSRSYTCSRAERTTVGRGHNLLLIDLHIARPHKECGLCPALVNLVDPFKDVLNTRSRSFDRVAAGVELTHREGLPHDPMVILLSILDTKLVK